MSLYASSHYYHWVTNSEAEHNAMETFYEELNELMDGFVEAMQGRYNMRVVMPTNLEMYPYRMKSEYFDNAVKDLESFIDMCESEDLKNKAAEIIELINTTKYRLTLR